MKFKYFFLSDDMKRTESATFNIAFENQFILGSVLKSSRNCCYKSDGCREVTNLCFKCVLNYATVFTLLTWISNYFEIYANN